MDLLHILPPETTTAILLIILSCAYIHALKYNARSATLAPSIFATIGILATFVGIALGLLHFDAKNVQASIPALLDGLRTAFWASVFGIGAALTVKLRVAIQGIPHQKGDTTHPEGSTIDDLAAHLISIQQCLAGEDDSTLITQLKLGRQESNDRLDRVRKVIEDFTQTMAENNSRALIEALEAVMRDFNSKINEQFGENFKQLNAAVSDILVWQQCYREQMGEMIALQERNTKSLEQASVRFESVVSNAERYTQTAHDLETLLQAIEIQRTSLQSSMTALGELFVSASRSLPEVEARIVDFAAQIAHSSKQAHDDITSATRIGVESMRTTVTDVINGASEQLRALEHSLKTVETTVLKCANQIHDNSLSASEVMVRATHDTAASLKSTLTDGQKMLSDGITAANDAMLKATHDHATAQKAALIDIQKTLNEGVTAANEGFNDQVQEMISKTKEQVTNLENALQAELTKSLSTLGSQLTALSKQFVNDYSPLTERLRELVAVGRV
ncbi:hypothetical protein [Insolitispirillum peregrinum]|uniref:hypothetical protein n=1 Tax=Insolitispirillum peregrinum TaxID=80876 RepID=UPI00361BFF38